MRPLDSNRRGEPRTRFARAGRLTAGVGLAAVCVIAAAGCAGSSQSADAHAGGSPIKIGLLTSLTGSASLFGIPTEDAARLPIAQINGAGGVLGRKLALDVGDDASNPSTGLQAASKLINGDNADLLVGMHSSATRQAVQSVPMRAGKIYLYTPVYEGGDCAPNTFAFGEIPNQQLQLTIPYMMSRYHAKRWYIVGDDYVWPHALAADASKIIAANGGSVAGQAFVPLGTTDFTSVVTKIKKAHPDLIFAPLVGADAVSFVKTAASFGLKVPYLAPLMEENTVAAIGGSADTGINTALGYFQSLNIPGNVKYLAAYHAMFGQKAPIQNSLSESVYEAINLWAMAAKKAGSISESKVEAAMTGLTFNGPRGPVTVEPSHHVRMRMYLAAAQPDGSLKVVRDFGEILPQTCGS